MNTILKKPPVPVQIKTKQPSESGDYKENVINIQEIMDYQDYSSEISKIYMGEMSYYSITLDIITIYLKGQKILYMESKTYCEMCLYFLMLPAIFISACCTVLSIGLKQYPFGSIIVSGLTATNSFILGIVTYLKLDAKAEAHKTTTYQFDKLQTLCEFYSGKTLMLKNEDIKKEINDFFKILEKSVSEIKDVNQFPIPEYIRKKYPKIYGQNVFSDMKKYKTIRNKNIQRLIIIDSILKERGNIEYTPVIIKKQFIEKTQNKDGFLKSKLKNMFNLEIPELSELSEIPEIPEDIIYNYSNIELKNEKDKLINKIIDYRNVSIRMNELFDEQLLKNNNNKTKHNCNRCCTYFCLKT